MVRRLVHALVSVSVRGQARRVDLGHGVGLVPPAHGGTRTILKNP